MTDLHPVFDDLAGTSGPIDAGVLDADLARGRSALRARRRNALVGSAFTVALALGVSAVAMGGGTSGPGGAANVQAAAPTVVAPAVSTPRIQFVAYTGDQPAAGFRVDSIPDGWTMQGVSQYTLNIVPPGLHTGMDSFVGKLVVMLESADADPSDLSDIPDGITVSHTTVDGRPAVIFKEAAGADSPASASLHWTDAAGHRVDVQWPQSAGWSDDEMTQFATGVHVLGAAKAGRG
jgi:hypothetical protein